ncbi:MAG TPA: hypothetical protein VFV67_35370 [Actinophytocola sp.]|uniref:hypothetical protein n=1 Tax=Actinophytocola sp. TaxID=1872138 RepID=UPI002DB8ADEE|nr:hypothetical protein [Actinophytocola sp.]HEU5475936.1 hypothetical protein [Actinophytocola sp.]
MCSPRTRIVLVVLAALALAVVGGVQLFAAPNSEPMVEAGPVATMDSLTTQVETATWTEMDHDMSGTTPGYQMPAGMMPGMPEGDDQRLAVQVTVTNTSSGTRPMRPAEEFTLRAGKDGRSIPAQTDTFSELPRLPAGNAVKGILFFDLPPADLAESAWIEWKRGDKITRLALPMDTASGGHGHSHGQ